MPCVHLPTAKISECDTQIFLKLVYRMVIQAAKSGGRLIAHRRGPTWSEIATELRFSYVTVRQDLRALRSAGRVHGANHALYIAGDLSRPSAGGNRVAVINAYIRRRKMVCIATDKTMINP